ncbi:MAG TPA: dihydrolipoamide acetyltransferase family protein [Bacteroidales bacterium]|nr:dihydrolipoamide acetyltransferase family protein [Bacteroidales bacterium]
MATPVTMPKLGQSVETCIITRWFKSTGDKVSTGDILFSYETDKAAFDMESPADGILLDIFFNEGDEVPVLANVAVIGEKGEETGSFRPGSSRPEDSPRTGTQTRTGIQADADIQPGAVIQANTGIQAGTVSQTAADTRLRISPRARRLALEKGLDYSRLRGSGPNSRIMVSDIEKLLLTGTGDIIPDHTEDKEYTDEAVSNVRKLIAKAMYNSLQNSAQLTHHMSADARKLLAERKRNKEAIASGSTTVELTLNDMVCWCVVQALKKFPEMNSHFLGETIRKFKRIHLGMAVDTKRGLMVPSVRNAESLKLTDLAQKLKSVAEACRKGNINPELILSTSASFTVSNLGSYGVEMFTPVLNLPQVAILGVCSIINRPADLGNNIFGFIPYIGLSLTYDHRAVDGGPATLFLKEIRKQIENFNPGQEIY